MTDKRFKSADEITIDIKPLIKRFMLDDAGTLIDMQTRDMFDIVEEVCPLLNELYEEKQRLNKIIEQICKDYEDAHGMDIRNTEWFTCW